MKLLSGKVEIEITTRCNMSCYYCPIQEIDNVDMPFDLFKKIVNLYDKPYMFMLQGTGEPTLHADLQKMIDYVHSKGHKAQLITNGKVEVAEGIAKSLDEIIVSVDDTVNRTDVKSLYHSRDNILKLQEHNKNITIYTVDVGCGTDIIRSFCNKHNLRHLVKDLHSNESYHVDYVQDKKFEVKSYTCTYTSRDFMDFFFVDGTKAPCCFMLHKEKALPRSVVKTSLDNGIVPEVCKGCNLLR